MSFNKPGRPRVFPIRKTAIARTILLMRRRLDLGQVEFSRLVLGKFTPGITSRWESGRMVPGTENLLRLLKTAGTPQERAPIVEALRSRGIDDLIAQVQPYLLSSLGNAPVPSSTSIAPPIEGGNVQIS